MKKPWSALITGSITTIPAILFLVFILLTTRGQYYASAYIIMGIVYFAASFFAGSLTANRFAGQVTRRRMALYLFLAVTLAWFFSLLVLMALDLTPLCVGQDNGDGNNDLPMCIFQTLLVSIFYTPPALLVIGMASLLASWLIPAKTAQKPS